MSYSVMFYSVDVAKIQKLFGSADKASLDEILRKAAEELDENDEFFADYDLPIDSRTALRNLVAGEVPLEDRSLAAMYGYVLKIVCETLGEFVGSDVYHTNILPIETRLLTTGPPVPIPVDPGDFPEIGYLTAAEVERELQAARNPLPVDSPHFFDRMREYTHHELDQDELLDELEAYQEILDDLVGRGLGVIAFRH